MIFPIIQPRLYPQGGELPLYKDVEWDFVENKAIWRDGSPSMVTGLPAVASWACNALQTMRGRYPIYNRDYGSELELLIGMGYSPELQQAEASRYVRECLLMSPYIQEVIDITVGFTDDSMVIACRLKTVYGEVDLQNV